ncbi:transcriptional regulator [Lentzea sp. NBRC 105346]|uniref:response regulator n=1 Tax=Lentzea sp. NBRC 105346 TaxID=3032205 RepID=UPI0024A56347|nr:response regulator transcription factor [Lentzea sp. NBRC 105346]GLZ32367.1 transcriptional regulator [Lentzea sp. NBRC 105346]
MNTEKLRVLIADDDRNIAGALCALLENEPDLSVVAVATDVEETIALAERHSPAVAVLDVRMPGGGGVHAARQLRRVVPRTKLMAFSAYLDDATIADIMDAGVSEYLIKGAPNDQILAVIRRLGLSA